MFVKFLKKRLLDDEKITVVLDKVAEGEKEQKHMKSFKKYYIIILILVISAKLKNDYLFRSSLQQCLQIIENYCFILELISPHSALYSFPFNLVSFCVIEFWLCWLLLKQ